MRILRKWSVVFVAIMIIGATGANSIAYAGFGSLLKLLPDFSPTPKIEVPATRPSSTTKANSKEQFYRNYRAKLQRAETCEEAHGNVDELLDILEDARAEHCESADSAAGDLISTFEGELPHCVGQSRKLRDRMKRDFVTAVKTCN